MKTGVIAAIITVAIVGIILGLIAYSYTQIQISLENISYQSLDVSLTQGSLVKAGINALLQNWLGAALDLITGVKLGLGFALSNHGFFPVYIPDVSYDLLINDVKVGQGQSHIDETINPGETKSIEDNQDIQFSSIKPAVASIVESGGVINFKVSGTAYFNFLGLSVPVPFESTRQVNVVNELKSHIFGSSQNSGYSNNSNPSSPLVGTSINIQSSAYTVSQGQTVTFSGRLTDSNGNGILNQTVDVQRDITLAPDVILGSSYTDSNGQFSVTWTATKPATSNTANIYAIFQGGSGYSSARSEDISIQVNAYQSTLTSNQNPSLSQQLELAGQKNPVSAINPNPSNSQVPSFLIANSVYQVGPHTYTYIPFNMQCSGTVTGEFSAQASLGNNIIVYVVDSTGFRQFQSGGSPYTYYNSGKVALGTLNIGLSSGQYYLILSNAYSTISTKNVNLVASYTCS